MAKDNKNIYFVGAMVLMVGLAVALSVVGNVYMVKPLAEKWVANLEQVAKNQAVDGCLQASSYETIDSVAGVTTTVPLDDVYMKCMSQKGY